MIRVKRLYGLPKPSDGKRFLADRLWLWAYLEAKRTGQGAHHGS